MKYFNYERAESFAEAAAEKGKFEKGRVAVMAGGTDLLGVLKDGLLKDGPDKVVSLKSVPDADYIKEENGRIEIGAMTRLVELAESPLLKDKAPIVAEAAYSVATPIIRNVGTIGGNVCQDVRCWFYRYPHQMGERFDCMRKGGGECYAIRGDNRYHSIFGGMKVHATPCSAECPANTDIPGYMAKLREGDYDGAAEILMQYNPLPMMTSRVCAHTCQSKCNRRTTDQSVSVHAVERSVGDYILDNADRFYAAPERETGKRIALAGAGPAGLAAAYYLRRSGHDVTVYDRLEEPGGCLTYAIPAYRLPKEYVKRLVEAFKKMGVKFKNNVEIGKDVTPEELERDYDKVFYATGAWSRPVLGFDGEEFTEFGLQFLKEVNQWIEKKARKNVLVVGGGNVAMDVAITCKRLGAEHVTLACLEQAWEMPASDEEVARAKEEGVVVMNGFGPHKLVERDGRVLGMSLKRCMSVFDENHRFHPVYNEEDISVVESDSVLMAAGQKVDLSFIRDKYVELSPRGLFIVDQETQRTARPGVFAGGDAASGPATVIKAIRSGRVAAESINREFGIENPEKYHAPKLIKFNPNGAAKDAAVKDHELSAADRALNIEDSSTISRSECLCEAERCMNCGCYSVNASDLSPTLVALDADLTTNKRTIRAREFFTTTLKAYDMLDSDELIEKISFKLPEGYKSGYSKFRVRKSIDFAIISLAYCYKLKDGRIADASLVFGGVAPVPMALPEVEELLIGREPSAELAKEAAELSVRDTFAMKDNAYKIEEARTLVKRLVEDMM